MLYISGDAGDQQAAYVSVLRAVQRGRIPRRRLDQAVGRILLAKQDYDAQPSRGLRPLEGLHLDAVVVEVGAFPSSVSSCGVVACALRPPG